MYKYLYCRQCLFFVGIQKKGNWLERIMGLELKPKEFCYNCGRSSADSISFECENGHSIARGEKFCQKCGGKVNDKEELILGLPDVAGEQN